MAHFAEIDKDNNVLRVVVISNLDIVDEQGNESEKIGQDFCHSLYGGNWIQTSYNGTFRKNYAGIGYTYDAERDAFIAPKPINASGFDEETCRWIVPINDDING